MATVSFPVNANKQYRNAFSAFARDRETTMAKLVRQALDEKYGAEMARYLSFVAKDGKLTNQLEAEITKS